MTAILFKGPSASDKIALNKALLAWILPWSEKGDLCVAFSTGLGSQWSWHDTYLRLASHRSGVIIALARSGPGPGPAPALGPTGAWAQGHGPCLVPGACCTGRRAQDPGLSRPHSGSSPGACSLQSGALGPTANPAHRAPFPAPLVPRARAPGTGPGFGSSVVARPAPPCEPSHCQPPEGDEGEAGSLRCQGRSRHL